MKHLNDEHYVEKNDQRYRIQPTENIILRKLNPPPSLRTQYQVENETQIKKNQKVVRDDNNDLVVEKYPKTIQPNIQQRKKNLPSCSSCKRNTWLQFDEGCYCQNCEHIINKHKHQID